MFIWLKLLFPSVIAGVICGLLDRGRWGIILGGAVPWFGLLAVLIYGEYFAPRGLYKGGGASMWPVAQVFAGTIMAALGALAAAFTQRAKAKYWGGAREQDRLDNAR